MGGVVHDDTDLSPTTGNGDGTQGGCITSGGCAGNAGGARDTARACQCRLVTSYISLFLHQSSQ